MNKPGVVKTVPIPRKGYFLNNQLVLGLIRSTVCDEIKSGAGRDDKVAADLTCIVLDRSIKGEARNEIHVEIAAEYNRIWDAWTPGILACADKIRGK